MLKIKDDVDMEEVEQFLLARGFYHCYGTLRNHKHFKVCKNKHLLPLNGGGHERFDVVYELTKADFIEKVEE